MNIKTNSTISALIASLALASCAYAELNDPPYFSLFAGGQGTTVELWGTEAPNPVANGKAVLSVFNGMPTGTGVIDPFLRLQHNEPPGEPPRTYEAAYNTNQRPLQNDNQPNGFVNQAKDLNQWNHAVMLGDLDGSDGYYHFFLDINEPGGTKSTLTVDELQFFIANNDKMDQYTRDEGVNGNTGGNPDAPPPGGKLESSVTGEVAAKVWDMDWDLWQGTNCTENNAASGCGGVVIDSVNASGGGNGSGDYDMEVKLDTRLFSSLFSQGYGASSFVYLYNFLGSADIHDDALFEAEAGFEEWAFLAAATPGQHGDVPEPATIALLAAGLAGMMGLGRRRKTRSVT